MVGLVWLTTDLELPIAGNWYPYSWPAPSLEGRDTTLTAEPGISEGGVRGGLGAVLSESSPWPLIWGIGSCIWRVGSNFGIEREGE